MECVCPFVRVAAHEGVVVEARYLIFAEFRASQDGGGLFDREVFRDGEAEVLFPFLFGEFVPDRRLYELRDAAGGLETAVFRVGRELEAQRGDPAFGDVAEHVELFFVERDP